MTDKQQRFGGGSATAFDGHRFGDEEADTPSRAFALAAAQARHEALLARAERRRWRGQESGGSRSATLLTFPTAPSLRSFALGLDVGPRPESCQWLYGDGPFADADKCGAPVQAGQSYCRAHLPRLFLEPDGSPAASESARR